MNELNIPDTQIAGLKALHSLDDSAFKKILERISSPVLPSPLELTHELAKATSISPAKIFSIVNTLISLHEVSQTENVLVEELAADIADVFGKKLGLNPVDVEQFRKRVETSLQKTEKFAIFVKARSVLTDNQRTFLECRILSDIRSIYTGEPDTTPAAAVILHTLKLVYFNNFQKEEFFVTLDTQDLKLLRSSLERAERKTESLEGLIKKAGIVYVDLAEE